MSLMKNYVELPVAKLVEAEWNYKKTDDKKSVDLMEKLKANLSKNGQIENLIVRELPKGKFEVVNGNHRLKALKSLKIKTAVCFNLGKITQPQAERLAIETNETKFERDPFKFAEMITRLAKEFDVDEFISTMPLSSDELENYTKLLKFDWDEAQKDDEKSEDEGGDGDKGEGWVEFTVQLPTNVYDLWRHQINRVKTALYPEKDVDDVSDVVAMECIAAHVAEIPDEVLNAGA